MNLTQVRNDIDTIPQTIMESMTEEPKRRGRPPGIPNPNAGKKPYPDEKLLKVRAMRMTDEEFERFEELGGIKWLRNLLGRKPS